MKGYCLTFTALVGLFQKALRGQKEFGSIMVNKFFFFSLLLFSLVILDAFYFPSHPCKDKIWRFDIIRSRGFAGRLSYETTVLYTVTGLELPLPQYYYFYDTCKLTINKSRLFGQPINIEIIEEGKMYNIPTSQLYRSSNGIIILISISCLFLLILILTIFKKKMNQNIIYASEILTGIIFLQLVYNLSP